MIFALQMVLALIVLILPGEAVIRGLAPDSRWGWARPFIAFGLGQFITTSLLWAMGMVGIPMWSWGICIIVVLSSGFLCYGYRSRPLIPSVVPDNSEPKPSILRRTVSTLPWLVLALATIFLAHHATLLALEHRLGSIPGMGNWAYKTKLLLITGDWPSDFFEYEAHNRRMGYPPGFPLLCGWCATFMGGLETHAIRLLPLILFIATFVMAGAEMVSRLKWWALPGIAGLLALFIGHPARSILSHFYAEPLLLFTAAVSVIALARAATSSSHTIIAILCAASIAWVKNEGLVLFVFLTGFTFLLANKNGFSRKHIAIATACTTLVLILPWRLYLMANHWHDESFASHMFFEEGNWDRLQASWKEYSRIMFSNGSRLGGAWWIALPLALISWQPKQKIIPVMILSAIGMTAAAILMMMASTEPDFDWHVAAAPRVLLTPSLILLMSFAYIKINRSQTS